MELPAAALACKVRTGQKMTSPKTVAIVVLSTRQYVRLLRLAKNCARSQETFEKDIEDRRSPCLHMLGTRVTDL
jgi:hypothetical protein